MALNIAIIGAGIAGVAAGRGLSARGCSVTLFEKSRGFGGRCASKRWEGHVVDHGAQYFTMRDDRFHAAVMEASGEAVLRMEAAVLDEQGRGLGDSGRFFHRDGNSRLARDLAHGLTARMETPIGHAETLLRSAGGDFDHVVSTAPMPQTARLFGVESAFEYIPCLTILAAYTGEWAGGTRACYAISDHSGPLAWSACENHKPGRVAAGQTVMVAQMSEAFSRENLERPPEELPGLVREMIEERWHLPAAGFVAGLGHRWRYARIARPMQPLALPPGMHFAGDALTASRVEDAWLAGMELTRRPEFQE